ncbi:phosphoglycerate mutase [Lactobacillus pasteurii DSM 23907 = CRBIP 24.76]|uniref:Phosphoglycerate mutase n=1 Tax=Lactobacillus pasteurii DSM 23907 = CRBIP 24.76 TaxID=1423790 RepID=I7IY94_9LACO|nr:histidine phosphatase family protein [Lactobacillus pasteurii]KRK07875.1 phosphoglycerate mutase [Lactobacillus pasteurii DSM 23907 = CRBIP 24.76]TDG77959.1 hypothetical protein C5L33_001764 [Lactobacillus pasteurii]CCI84357.1 Phosphoglycerate mutase [Lactobacillus pasteurii DSM 23907 = CRBIP 24.76]
MELTFIRHGQTGLNKENRIQGSATNYPLDEEGRSQAQAAAANFDPSQYDVVFVSPLARAQETAKIFTKGQKELITDERIKEFDFGSWDAQLISELRANYPDAFDEWGKVTDKYLTYATDAESQVHLGQRCQEFIDELRQKYPDGKVLVVAHGTLIRMMAACLVEAGKMSNFQTMDNCGLAKFEVKKNTSRMLYYNRVLA